MRRHLFRAIGLFGLLALGMLTVVRPAAAEGPDTLDKILKRGKILVGIDLSVPPYGITNKEMQPDGADVDVAKLLAKDLGVKLEIVSVNGASRIPTLLSGKADVIISSFSITPERAKTVAFSIPYGEHQDVVVGKADETIKDFADLKNKRVGVTRGTISEQVLEKQNIPGIHLIRLENDSANLAALATGQVDAIGTADVLAAELIKRYPDQHFQVKFAFRKGYFGIGLRRFDPDFQRWLNSFVFFNMANGKLSAIAEKWEGVSFKFLPTF